MQLGRKSFLRMTAASPFAWNLTRQAQAAQAAGVPGRFGQSKYFDPDLLVHRNQIGLWMEWMSQQGPRYTGNPAHAAFINFLRYEFEVAGLKVQNYPYSFTRWDVNSYGLTTSTMGGEPTTVKTSSYYVRSGQTSARGVTAPLVYGGTAEGTATVPPNAKGNIVYLDFVMPPIPLQALFVPFGSYPTGTVAGVETNAAFSFVVMPGFIALPGLQELQAAGAVGAIVGWNNISDAQAQDQYQPFTIAQTQIPTLFVPQSQTLSMKELALAGQTEATLTLDASTYPNTPTETIIATLPGLTNEIIIINTHTDGPNVVEENGGLALLAMARYFARIPIQQRNKTLVFVLATGHMDEPSVPSDMWLAQRPDIIDNAVASITIEHLGAQQWLDNAQGVYQYTGKNEYAFAQTQNTGMATSFLSALQGTIAEPTIVANPVAYFGLCEPIDAAGVPVNGFLTGPAYLLTGSPNGEIEKVDFRLMYSQIQALTTQVRMLDGMTAAQIAGVRNPAPPAARRRDLRRR
jgi:hypothetical protein